MAAAKIDNAKGALKQRTKGRKPAARKKGGRTRDIHVAVKVSVDKRTDNKGRHKLRN